MCMRSRVRVCVRLCDAVSDERRVPDDKHIKGINVCSRPSHPAVMLLIILNDVIKAPSDCGLNPLGGLRENWLSENRPENTQRKVNRKIVLIQLIGQSRACHSEAVIEYPFSLKNNKNVFHTMCSASN